MKHSPELMYQLLELKITFIFKIRNRFHFYLYALFSERSVPEEITGACSFETDIQINYLNKNQLETDSLTSYQKLST